MFTGRSCFFIVQFSLKFPSFGIVLWEILSRKIPYEGLPAAAISPVVITGQRPPIENDWPHELVNLMKDCWNYRPEVRPSVKEARYLHTLFFLHSVLSSLSFRTIVEAWQSEDPLKSTKQVEAPAPPKGNVTFVCYTVQPSSVVCGFQREREVKHN